MARLSKRPGRRAHVQRRNELRASLREKERENGRLVRAAEDRVFAHLEKRWAHQLGGRKIPESHRRAMRQDVFFMETVMRHLAGEPLAELDLDFTDDRELVQKDDGSVTTLLTDELKTDDPSSLYCPMCMEETDRPGKVCSACIEFRRTGNRS